MTDRKLYLGPLTDNRRWDKVAIRPDDVIIAAPPKCGTTWMQVIVALLLSGDPEVEPQVSLKMPWVDMRLRDMDEVAARLEAMTHRRCLKSHTPLDGLPYDERALYISVFRHPLDAHFSFRHHVRTLPLPVFQMWYPEEDPDDIAFQRFLDGGAEGFDMDLVPLAHILRHYHAARALADRPNVVMVHYADMIRDLPGTFAEVAAHLGVSHPPEVMEALIRTARFDHMRANAERFAPGAGTDFNKDAAQFFHSGTSGKWVGALSAADIAAYDAVIDAVLSPRNRAWLEFGDTGLQAG